MGLTSRLKGFKGDKFVIDPDPITPIGYNVITANKKELLTNGINIIALTADRTELTLPKPRTLADRCVINVSTFVSDKTAVVTSSGSINNGIENNNTLTFNALTDFIVLVAGALNNWTVEINNGVELSTV